MWVAGSVVHLADRWVALKVLRRVDVKVGRWVCLKVVMKAVQLVELRAVSSVVK